MSKSVIVTVFILSFLIVYGDFMGPAIFLSGIRTTLPVAMTTGYVIRNGILLVPVLLDCRRLAPSPARFLQPN